MHVSTSFEIYRLHPGVCRAEIVSRMYTKQLHQHESEVLEWRRTINSYCAIMQRKYICVVFLFVLCAHFFPNPFGPPELVDFVLDLDRFPSKSSSLSDDRPPRFADIISAAKGLILALTFFSLSFPWNRCLNSNASSASSPMAA